MFRKLLKAFLYAVLAVFMVVIFIYHFTSWVTANKHSAEINDLPKAKVALVLGTSNLLSNGQPNLYFKYRIQAAVDLFEKNKVKFILVSGDNRKTNYNEPKRMREALIKKGIPHDRIFLDYAGFRTLASVVRAKEVFGQNAFIVVSQPFHNERAIYIAQNKNLTVYGYDAQKVSAYSGFKTIVREHLARVKMMLDLYILRTEPKFLGEEIRIE